MAESVIRLHNILNRGNGGVQAGKPSGMSFSELHKFVSELLSQIPGLPQTITFDDPNYIVFIVNKRKVGQ